MSDYFIVMRENNPKYPLLGWRQSSMGFYGKTPIEINEPIKLGIGDPVPKEYEMVDFHSLPRPVVSKKIKDVLAPMDIYGIQLLPATIEGEKGDTYDYWLLRIYNKFSCMNKEKSKYKDYGINNRHDYAIQQLVLDEKVLENIPLEERLIFRLSEDAGKEIFHKSIRDAIMAVNPVGIKFVDVDDWGLGSSFE